MSRREQIRALSALAAFVHLWRRMFNSAADALLAAFVGQCTPADFFGRDWLIIDAITVAVGVGCM